MGDRSNIAIVNEGYSMVGGRLRRDRRKDARVYLYGHWMGEGAILHAVHGLKSGRTTDGAYLARIIFSSMIKDSIDSEIGFGISTYLLDSNHPTIVINPNGGECVVWLEDEDDDPCLTEPVSAAKFVETVEAGSVTFNELVRALRSGQ